MGDLFTLNLSELAVVVIGRNEGARLGVCLSSVIAQATQAIVVYVDSGSTDDSVALATGMGCQVVSLDMAVPFTAARARNEGFAKARQLRPGITSVQFVDGDCELVATWLSAATGFLARQPKVAVVAGRLRERYPDRSVYNRLCDYEWNVPEGATKSCGGIALFRVSVFTDVGGFREGLIAGEEPELCVRLRTAGWQVWRLGDAMALHDANMVHFSQWWIRSKRAGYAFAEGAWIHGAGPTRHYVGEVRRAAIWGVLIPILIAVAAIVSSFAFVLLLVYPLQVLRVAFRLGLQDNFSWVRSFFLTLSKFPESLGVAKFYWNKLRGRVGGLIEYK